MLHEGPYLAGLRQLAIVGYLRTTPQSLRALLDAAISLEGLDLGRYHPLQLRGTEDAALLRTLPQLQRVLLPCLMIEKGAPAAIERIREGLRAVTQAGAGPWHAVEVESITYF